MQEFDPPSPILAPIGSQGRLGSFIRVLQANAAGSSSSKLQAPDAPAGRALETNSPRSNPRLQPPYDLHQDSVASSKGHGPRPTLPVVPNAEAPPLVPIHAVLRLHVAQSESSAGPRRPWAQRSGTSRPSCLPQQLLMWMRGARRKHRNSRRCSGDGAGSAACNSDCEIDPDAQTAAWHSEAKPGARRAPHCGAGLAGCFGAAGHRSGSDSDGDGKRGHDEHPWSIEALSEDVLPYCRNVDEYGEALRLMAAVNRDLRRALRLAARAAREGRLFDATVSVEDFVDLMAANESGAYSWGRRDGGPPSGCSHAARQRDADDGLPGGGDDGYGKSGHSALYLCLRMWPYVQVQTCLLPPAAPTSKTMQPPQGGHRQRAAAGEPGLRITHSATPPAAAADEAAGASRDAVAAAAAAPASLSVATLVPSSAVGATVTARRAALRVKGLAADSAHGMITVVDYATGAVIYQNQNAEAYMGEAPPVDAFAAAEAREEWLLEQQQLHQNADAVPVPKGHGGGPAAAAPVRVPLLLRELLRHEPGALDRLQACLQAGEEFEETVQVPPTLAPFLASLRDCAAQPVALDAPPAAAAAAPAPVAYISVGAATVSAAEADAAGTGVSSHVFSADAQGKVSHDGGHDGGGGCDSAGSSPRGYQAAGWMLRPGSTSALRQQHRLPPRPVASVRRRGNSGGLGGKSRRESAGASAGGSGAVAALAILSRASSASQQGLASRACSGTSRLGRMTKAGDLLPARSGLSAAPPSRAATDAHGLLSSQLPALASAEELPVDTEAEDSAAEVEQTCVTGQAPVLQHLLALQAAGKVAQAPASQPLRLSAEAALGGGRGFGGASRRPGSQDGMLSPPVSPPQPVPSSPFPREAALPVGLMPSSPCPEHSTLAAAAAGGGARSPAPSSSLGVLARRVSRFLARAHTYTGGGDGGSTSGGGTALAAERTLRSLRSANARADEHSASVRRSSRRSRNTDGAVEVVDEGEPGGEDDSSKAGGAGAAAGLPAPVSPPWRAAAGAAATAEILGGRSKRNQLVVPSSRRITGRASTGSWGFSRAPRERASTGEHHSPRHSIGGLPLPLLSPYESAPAGMGAVVSAATATTATPASTIPLRPATATRAPLGRSSMSLPLLSPSQRRYGGLSPRAPPHGGILVAPRRPAPVPGAGGSYPVPSALIGPSASVPASVGNAGFSSGIAVAPGGGGVRGSGGGGAGALRVDDSQRPTFPAGPGNSEAGVGEGPMAGMAQRTNSLLQVLMSLPDRSHFFSRAFQSRRQAAAFRLAGGTAAPHSTGRASASLDLRHGSPFAAAAAGSGGGTGGGAATDARTSAGTGTGTLGGGIEAPSDEDSVYGTHGNSGYVNAGYLAGEMSELEASPFALRIDSVTALKRLARSRRPPPRRANSQAALLPYTASSPAAPPERSSLCAAAAEARRKSQQRATADGMSQPTSHANLSMALGDDDAVVAAAAAAAPPLGLPTLNDTDVLDQRGSNGSVAGAPTTPRSRSRWSNGGTGGLAVGPSRLSASGTPAAAVASGAGGHEPSRLSASGTPASAAALTVTRGSTHRRLSTSGTVSSAAVMATFATGDSAIEAAIAAAHAVSPAAAPAAAGTAHEPSVAPFSLVTAAAGTVDGDASGTAANTDAGVQQREQEPAEGVLPSAALATAPSATTPLSELEGRCDPSVHNLLVGFQALREDVKQVTSGTGGSGSSGQQEPFASGAAIRSNSALGAWPLSPPPPPLPQPPLASPCSGSRPLPVQPSLLSIHFKKRSTGSGAISGRANSDAPHSGRDDAPLLTSPTAPASGGTRRGSGGGGGSFSGSQGGGSGLGPVGTAQMESPFTAAAAIAIGSLAAANQVEVPPLPPQSKACGATGWQAVEDSLRSYSSSATGPHAPKLAAAPLLGASAMSAPCHIDGIAEGAAATVTAAGAPARAASTDCEVYMSPSLPAAFDGSLGNCPSLHGGLSVAALVQASACAAGEEFPQALEGKASDLVSAGKVALAAADAGAAAASLRPLDAGVGRFVSGTVGGDVAGDGGESAIATHSDRLPLPAHIAAAPAARSSMPGSAMAAAAVGSGAGGSGGGGPRVASMDTLELQMAKRRAYHEGLRRTCKAKGAGSDSETETLLKSGPFSGGTPTPASKPRRSREAAAARPVPNGGRKPFYRQTTHDRIESLLQIARAEHDSGAVDSGSGAMAADRGAAAGGGAAATQPVGPIWHNVHVSVCTHPAVGAPVLVVTQYDVTQQMDARTQLTMLLEREQKVLESIFPRHVIEYLTLHPIGEGAGSRCGRNTPMPRNGSFPRRGGVAGGGGGGDGGAGPSGAAAGLLALQRNGAAQLASVATAHPSVTILFADIVGFTSMSKQVSPLEVMTFLNQLYSRFDNLLDIYKVYKVETIGDCFMVAGGLVAQDEEGWKTTITHDRLHAVRVMAFAKAMLREARKVQMPTGGPVLMRVGIHSGPVMSGVVGSRMPRFCLFGDTVNTASRMESTSRPGRIHVSGDTQALLPNERWEPTGGVQVKGKGVMPTYLWASDVAEEKGEQLQRVLGVYL